MDIELFQFAIVIVHDLRHKFVESDEAAMEAQVFTTRLRK